MKAFFQRFWLAFLILAILLVFFVIALTLFLQDGVDARGRQPISPTPIPSPISLLT